MAVNLSPIGGVAGQFFDNNGDPLVGGKLFTYAAGTTTPQVTYTSATGVTPNSNPIILNGGGRVPSEIWLTDGLQYKFVLYSSTDQLIGSWDNIIGINSNFVNFVTSEEVQTATAGQTVFTLTTMQYQPGTNNLVVYVDGVNQIEGGAFSFVETSSTVVTFTNGLHVGALVKFVSAETLSTGVTDASLVAFTGFKSQSGSVQDLADDDGSDWIGYEPAGTGAVAMSVQDKLRETVSLEDFGASSTSFPTDNATAFINAIQSGKKIIAPQQAYTFQFDGTPIIYTGTVLDIDLGCFKHTFLNFGGIVGDNLVVLRYNGRFGANNGFCKGLGRFRDLLLVDIDTIEITDVYVDANSGEPGFFGVEYSSNIFSDNQLTFSVKNAVFKNIIIETVSFAGNPVAMTGFGNFGSSSTQSQKHVLYFDNLYVENFFSVSSDGVTVVDGDSDFFRLFTNPTQLTIGNCTLINVGKRFIKTQEKAEVVVNNLVASLDARFPSGVYIGMFEAQATAQTSAPTRFTILQADVQFGPTNTIPPFFNASGLDHEMYVYNMTYSNIGAFSASQNVRFYAENLEGSRLFINTPFSEKITLRNIVDTNFIQAVGRSDIENFKLTIPLTTLVFPISSGALRNGSFEGVDINSRVAAVREISNVTLNYTTGTSTRRPFTPSGSGIVKIEGLTVNSIGPSTQTFESSGGSGTMIIRDYRSTNQTLAFFSSGTWNFVLDNCINDTVTGAGVVSVVRATYV